jgi:lysophospholipase L1-like esterase
VNRNLKRLLLGLLVAAGVLGGAEAIARWVRPPAPPILVAPPQRAQAFEIRDGRVSPVFQRPFQIPSFAMAPRGQRVVAIGGSTVRAGAEPALGLDGEFPALLEAALGVEVLNLGVPGANAEDLLRRFPEVLGFSPDVVLIYSGHNAYVMATQVGLDEELGQSRTRLGLLLRRSSLFLALDEQLTPPPALVGERPRFALGPLEREAVRREHLVHLRAMVELAQAAGVPVVLSTVASNPFAPPVAQDCPEVFDALGLDRPMLGSEHRPLDLAGLRPEQTQDLDLDCIQARYLHGRALWDAGRHAEAREHLDAARDLETLPMRADRAMNEDLRALAEQTGVALVDADRAFRARGLGLEPPTWMADVLHPNAAGHQALAALFAPETARLLGRPDPRLPLPSTAPGPSDVDGDAAAPASPGR